jgi:hypothetical protein
MGEQQPTVIVIQIHIALKSEFCNRCGRHALGNKLLHSIFFVVVDVVPKDDAQFLYVDHKVARHYSLP